MPTTNQPQKVLSQLSPENAPQSIYVLTGAEDYYIDKIEKKIVSTYVDPSTADFNFSQFYGSEVTGEEVVAAARRFPMMAERVVVVVREAQNMRNVELLENIAHHSIAPNVLVLTFKTKAPDRRKPVFKALEKAGLFFVGEQVRDYQIDPHISGIAAGYGLQLSGEAVREIAENVGTNLTNIDKEMQKLSLALPASPDGSPRIVTPEEVHKYTSVIKGYNPFEFLRALIQRDLHRANKIALALAEDQKKVPVQMALSVLFNYFANLFVAFYARPQSEKGVMEKLRLRNSYQIRDYMIGLRSYNAHQVMSIISYLRKSDARSKGLYGFEGKPYDIYSDLVFFIFHTQGGIGL